MDDEFAFGIIVAVILFWAAALAVWAYFFVEPPPPRHHLYYCELKEGGFEICGDLDVTISVSNLYLVQPRGIG